MTVTSLLLVFVHYTYIKVSFVSVSSLPSRCVDPSGKRKRKNQVFCSVFFLVSLILCFYKKHIYAHPSSSSFFFPFILFLFLATRKKKTYRQTYSKAKKKKKRTRKMLMILTNSIRRKDEQERHLLDIVVF